MWVLRGAAGMANLKRSAVLDPLPQPLPPVAWTWSWAGKALCVLESSSAPGAPCTLYYPALREEAGIQGDVGV